MCAIELSKDLKESVGKPFVLFSASEAKPFVKRYFFRNYVTDGPFLIRTEDEKLHMLWSTNAKTGYVEAMHIQIIMKLTETGKLTVSHYMITMVDME